MGKMVVCGLDPTKGSWKGTFIRDNFPRIYLLPRVLLVTCLDCVPSAGSTTKGRSGGT